MWMRLQLKNLQLKSLNLSLGSFHQIGVAFWWVICPTGITKSNGTVKAIAQKHNELVYIVRYHLGNS